MHRKRFPLSAAGQPVQYLPSTEQYLPTAMAVFGSIGQKPALVKAFCVDDFFLGAIATSLRPNKKRIDPL